MFTAAAERMPIFTALFGGDQALYPKSSQVSRSSSESYDYRSFDPKSLHTPVNSPPEKKNRKKPGRKPVEEDDDIPITSAAPVTKRKAQNRAAQRAFRERKEKYVKGLEDRIQELEDLVSGSTSTPNNVNVPHVQEENRKLKQLVSKLRAENEELKNVYVTSVQDVLNDLYASVGQDVQVANSTQTKADLSWTPPGSSSESDRTMGESPHMMDPTADLSVLIQPGWFPQLPSTDTTPTNFGGMTGDQVVTGNGMSLFGAKSSTPRTPVAFNAFKDTGDYKNMFGGYRDPAALDLDTLLGTDAQRGMLHNDPTLLPGLFDSNELGLLSKTALPRFVDPSASTAEKEAAVLHALKSPPTVQKSACTTQVHPLVRVAPELGLLAPAELDDLCDKLKKKCKTTAEAVNNAMENDEECPPEVRQTLQRVMDGMKAE